MYVVARTPAALYRQMRDQGRGIEELELVRRALDLDIDLYSARFEPDGTPFQVHGIGTASVVAQAGGPAYAVAAAMVHNAFNQGDWADGHGSGAYAQRRARVRDALGEEAEQLLVSVYGKPRQSTGELLAGVELEPIERWRLVIRIADLLDKWDDGRVMYSGAGRGDRRFVAEHRPEILELARRYGTEELAASLEVAFERVDAETIPESLKATSRYSRVIPPPSYRKRRPLVAKAATYRFLRRAKHLAATRLGR